MDEDSSILLSIQQAAKKIGKSEKTIRRWIKAGKLNAEKHADGGYLIKREDLAVLTSPPQFFLPRSPSNGLLTERQFDEWCQQHVIGHSTGSGTLRFDGLYRAKNGKEYYDSYLRFSTDGTVLSVSAIRSYTTEQVAQLFEQSPGASSHGKYKRLGAQIAFFTTYGGVVVDYVGAVVDDHMICLESYSHRTKYRDWQWYHYEQVANLVQ